MSQAPSTRNTTTYIHLRKVTIVAPSPKHTSRVICITPKKCTRRDIPQLVATLCRNVAYGSGRCVNSVPRDPPNLGRKCTPALGSIGDKRWVERDHTTCTVRDKLACGHMSMCERCTVRAAEQHGRSYESSNQVVKKSSHRATWTRGRLELVPKITPKVGANVSPPQ